jgi:multiple sugar transport system substrate-binding protein
VIEVAKAREIVGEPIVVAIAGGDVDSAIDNANTAFGDFLLEDSE